MKIQVGSDWGMGSSRKSSFDSALRKLGIHEYNLVEYSSVIPENARIVEKNSFETDINTGHPCAVVLAKDTIKPEESEPATSDLAYSKSESNGGVFLEGNGSLVSKQEIEELKQNRQSYEWEDSVNNISCIRQSDERLFTTAISVAFFGEIETKYR